MSGIMERAVTALYYLHCDVCDTRWESDVIPAAGWGDERIDVCRPAFDDGWRVYVGARSQRTYCPDHEPKTPMRLLHGNTSLLASLLREVDQ